MAGNRLNLQPHADAKLTCLVEQVCVPAKTKKIPNKEFQDDKANATAWAPKGQKKRREQPAMFALPGLHKV